MEPKYKVGDKVVILTESIKGQEGTITRILDGRRRDNPKGDVFIIENEHTRNGYVMNALQFEKINRFEDEKTESGCYCEAAQEMFETSSAFFTPGDVVKIHGDMDGFNYVIEEAIREDQVLNGGLYPVYYYQMKLIGPCEPDWMHEETLICDEAGLDFRYRDTTWGQYYTEGNRQSVLPPWRGELYNLYSCYSDPGRQDYFDHTAVKEYENHTIPPLRMKHILRSHGIYDRILDVIGNGESSRIVNNRKRICESLNIDDDELSNIATAIRNKIIERNKSDIGPDKLRKLGNMYPGFTLKEYDLVTEIDRLDISGGRIKDHFPVDWTNLQIMDAIKDAYESEGITRMDGRHRCKGEREGADEDLDAPELGKSHFRGHSIKYDMDIEFLYNFDHNFIETAYPLRMNKKPERHIRDRLDRK